ncbi:MAG: questin oxidase family protein [Deltaproteobacteria bacterium]|nr:questin oxidase family protein [Deltaproteobacteria bacterium]
MTLLALHGLGASDAQVQAFIRAWPRHRAPIDDGALGLVDTGTLTEESWHAYLGRPERLLELRRVFQAGLDGPEGLTTVIRALGVMRAGLPMGLFHPLIRLSFALDYGDRGMIADALAYMAIRHFDLFRGELPRSAPSASARPAVDVWRALEPTAGQLGLIASLGGASIHVCERLCGDPSLQRAALPVGFEISEGALPLRMREIAALAIRLYVDTPSLTTLHAVTALHALAALTSKLGAEAPEIFVDLWKRYWIWLTALYLEKGRPALPEAVTEPTAPEVWGDLSARALARPEVHLVKMTYSCRWLDEALGPDPLYAVAVLGMLGEA